MKICITEYYEIMRLWLDDRYFSSFDFLLFPFFPFHPFSSLINKKFENLLGKVFGKRMIRYKEIICMDNLKIHLDKFVRNMSTVRHLQGCCRSGVVTVDTAVDDTGHLLVVELARWTFEQFCSCYLITNFSDRKDVPDLFYNPLFM